MSKYFIGVDMGFGGDYTAYTVMHKPSWYDRLLRKLRLSKATWEWKVVVHWAEPPTEGDK